jgi:hypothetical protein
MRKIYLACATALALTAVASPAFAGKKQQLTPMQIQAMQQKEFEAPKATLFASVIDVLQDLGYTVGSADMSTGFITAESATVNKTSMVDAFLAHSSGSGNTRATAFIEQMPSGMTRVRLNFVASKTLSSQWGQNSRQDTPIVDPEVYQRAFEKVDEAMFVRTASNAPAKPTEAATAPAAPTATSN